MAINVNHVELIGTIACEPVFDHTTGGTPVCKFVVSTSDKFQSKTRSSNHNVSVLGPALCDIIRTYGRVGKTCLIRGRLEYWNDENQTRLVDVRATYVEFDK